MSFKDDKVYASVISNMKQFMESIIDLKFCAKTSMTEFNDEVTVILSQFPEWKKLKTDLDASTTNSVVGILNIANILGWCLGAAFKDYSSQKASDSFVDKIVQQISCGGFIVSQPWRQTVKTLVEAIMVKSLIKSEVNSEPTLVDACSQVEDSHRIDPLSNPSNLEFKKEILKEFLSEFRLESSCKNVDAEVQVTPEKIKTCSVGVQFCYEMIDIETCQIRKMAWRKRSNSFQTSIAGKEIFIFKKSKSVGSETYIGCGFSLSNEMNYFLFCRL